MPITVAEMTKEKLQDLIGAVVEEKLQQLFADPDEGLEIHDELRDRLLRHQKSISTGESGKSLDDVMTQLGLD